MANGNGKFTAEQMIEAIRDADGIIASAARKLGTSRQTVHNYVNRYATVKAAYEEARDTNIDYAESQLMRAVQKGSLPAIMFMLKTIGRNRGYVERQEVANEGEMTVKVEYVNRPYNSTVSVPPRTGES